MTQEEKDKIHIIAEQKMEELEKESITLSSSIDASSKAELKVVKIEEPEDEIIAVEGKELRGLAPEMVMRILSSV